MKSEPLPVFIALFFTMFFEVFNFTMTNMASPYIVGDLGGSNEIATYTITFFSIGNALSIPMGKYLSIRLGRLRLLLICLSLFALFTWACGTAPTYPVYLAFRFFKGFCSGPLYFLVINFIFYLAGQENRKKCSAIMVTIFAVGPVLGACWGGWIAYDYNWRWIFHINVPILLFLIMFFYIRLQKHETPPQKMVFNPVGYVSYVIGIFCLSFVITTGQEFDWYRCWPLVGLFILGLLSFTFYLLWDWNHNQPILQIHFFKKPIFCFALSYLALLFSAYFGMIILIPLWLNLFVNYTPLWIAVLIGSMAIAGIFPSMLILDKFGKLDYRIPLGLAILFFAISCFHTTIFDQYVNFGRIAFSRIIAGFGLALFLPPIFRACFESFEEKRSPDVLELFQTVRALSCGLGASIYTTIWQRRAIFFHDRLGSQITAFSPDTKKYYFKADQVGLKGEFASAKLNDLLDRQSTALGLDDTFYLMAWIMVGLLVILAFTFLYRSKPLNADSIHQIRDSADRPHPKTQEG